MEVSLSNLDQATTLPSLDGVLWKYEAMGNTMHLQKAEIASETLHRGQELYECNFSICLRNCLRELFLFVRMSTPSRPFGERRNAGEVCCELNVGSIAKPASWKGKGEAAVIRHLPSGEEALQCQYKYMFQRISDTAAGIVC